MKNPSASKLHRGCKSLVLLSFTCLFFTFCAKEVQYWELTSDRQGAAEYVAYHPDQYGEFAKLIELTGFTGILNLRGPYTVMVPTNEAMLEYYKEKNVTSLMDFTDAFRQSLIRNHIFGSLQETRDMFVGAVRDTNALGDYLESEFKEADIYLNKTAKIIKHDLPVANGYIHVIDKVLDPVTKDIYTIISADPAYRIFSEGLRLTGIKDTLQLIFIPYGRKTTRNRFTVFAVPDTIYQRYGIRNVNDLITWCGASPDSLTSKMNSFYSYIEYHCLNGTFYLNYFWTRNLTVLSAENNISMTIDNQDYKINLDTITKKYTGFIIPACNIPAKNGVIHTVNDLLPVFYPKPKAFYFETTDYPDLKQGDYYHKYYMKWYDGQNSFEKIKFQGDYLQYYHISDPIGHGGILMDCDCLSMAGDWWIEITTPKITKGCYRISSNIWNGDPNYPCFAVYIDGRKISEINATLSIGGSYMYLGEINWANSGEHKIKLVSTVAGRLFWDSVIFTPITDK